MEDLEPSHAGADQNADAGLVQLLKLLRALGKPRVCESALGRDDCVLEAVVIAALVLLVDHAIRGKALDLGSELGWEL